MSKFKVLLFTVISLTLWATLATVASAEVVPEENVQTEDMQTNVEVSKEVAPRTNNVCGFRLPEEETNYGAQVITVRSHLRVNPGEAFQVKVFMKNTGNMPWFSEESQCPGPKMFLGTDRERDRISDFYELGLDGWREGNRIKMDQDRTNPGEIASFTFEAMPPLRNTVYKEFFTPVLEGIQWIDSAGFHLDTIVGDGGVSARDAILKLDYANRSGSTDYLDLNAEKVVNVKLSEQNVYLKLGDEVVRVFRISTGKASTPTPVGTTSITLKQDVRIGGKPPHYIMPKFMWFRAGGYGFHALPSIGSAGLRAQIRRLQAAGKEVPVSLYYGDALWREAYSNIGIPVSDGCIRLMPDDADWMFDFVEIGTKVVVER